MARGQRDDIDQVEALQLEFFMFRDVAQGQVSEIDLRTGQKTLVCPPLRHYVQR